MPSRNVTLTDHLDRFIESGVGSGRFHSADEVVVEALQLLEQQEEQDQAQIDTLRHAVQQSVAELDRGEGLVFENIDELAVYIDSIAGEVEAEADRRA